jgi:hypothetical protein
MQIKLKLNIDIATPKGKVRAGTILELEVDSDQNLLDGFWRKRLKDARIDSCVEVLTEQKNKKVKK